MTMTDLYYDPYDYAIDADPYPIWRRLRDEAPLYYNDRHDFFAISRFDDVREASADWNTFSSANGSVLELIKAPMDVVEQARNMLFEDPPIHDAHRAILSRVFTPRRIADLEPRIRELCAQYLDPLVGRERFDLIQEFGALLPMMVIGSMLGVPEEDQDWVRRQSDDQLHRDEGETDYKVDSQMEGFNYFSQLAAQRRENPHDDLITALVQSTVAEKGAEPRPINDVELAQYIGLVSAAGNETVARLIGWAGKLFAEHPDQRRLVAGDPAKAPGAVEELLRIEPPSPVQARLVTRDVDFHGQTVPQGSALVLITGSAGRDERVFDDPDRFDVQRPIEQHLSLGFGIHYCLGAALARLEGRIAVEELLARFPDFEVDLDDSEMVHTSTVRGWERLVVVRA
jgi:cytochrome P450